MRKKCYIILSFVLIVLRAVADPPYTPIMGWSSWNHFRVNIDEKMIREQADALLNSGMYDAGYRFINIDDGYFGGRDANGKLFCDSLKFPSGMKSLADYIHSKGLKAGIYSDAGSNTCGSIWDNDKNGIGVGLYGHVEGDCTLLLKEWGYDFLKVDWCGGEKQGLDEETEYLSILHQARSIRPDVVFNVCRWKFPGEWVIKEADSWRISGDIAPTWESICYIIDLNAGLAKYASPGHFNDMDMLQVGRGMTYEEDKSHFSMWCMMCSPLLAGNDLRNMSPETIEILTNSEMIAVHQDSACIQAERIAKEGQTELWVKPLSRKGKAEQKAVAVLNRSNEPIEFFLSPEQIQMSSRAQMRDLWMHKNLGKIGKGISLKIPAHGIVVLRVY